MWEEAGPSPTAAPCPWGQPCHPVTPAGPWPLLLAAPRPKGRPQTALQTWPCSGALSPGVWEASGGYLTPTPPATLPTSIPTSPPTSFLGTAMHIRGFGPWPWVLVGRDCPPILYCTLWRCGRAGGLTWGTARADKTRLHEAQKRRESQRSNSAPLCLS